MERNQVIYLGTALGLAALVAAGAGCHYDSLIALHYHAAPKQQEASGVGEIESPTTRPGREEIVPGSDRGRTIGDFMELWKSHE
jgi:hypothetical protein